MTSDQLSLGMAAAAPRLPSDLRPMLARSADEPFDDPAWLFEPSWESLRALAHVEGGRLRLVDPRGREVSGRFPDLLGLIDAVAAAPAVLDGEIVIPDASGAPDPDALHRRLEVRGRRSGGAPRGRALFLANDGLFLEGRSLLREPLQRRRERLPSALRLSDHLVVVPTVAGDGRALFDAIGRTGLPGMLARRADSPYLPGVRSDLWRQIRVAPRFEAVVGGFMPRADGSVSLLLGAWDREALHGDRRPASGRLVAVGAADAPGGSDLAAALERSLRQLTVAATPFARGARAEYRWVRPELVVTVEHRGWSGARMTEPRLVTIREELDAQGCRLPRSEPLPEDSPGERRRPVLALLQRLPLAEG